MRTLVWFRNDLRVDDNPALYHASRRGEVVAAFCFCSRQWRDHDMGDNRLAFLLDSLHSLAADLGRLGIALRTISAPTFDALPHQLVGLAQETGAEALSFNAEYPHDERSRDALVTRACTASGVAVHVHHGGVILPPGHGLTAEGGPYTVFTPFRRRWRERFDAADATPLPAHRAVRQDDRSG